MTIQGSWSKCPVRVGGACWTWKPGPVIQYSLWVIFCYWNFCFQIPILALLPFLCILKKLYYLGCMLISLDPSVQLVHRWYKVVQYEHSLLNNENQPYYPHEIAGGHRHLLYWQCCKSNLQHFLLILESHRLLKKSVVYIIVLMYLMESHRLLKKNCNLYYCVNAFDTKRVWAIKIAL